MTLNNKIRGLKAKRSGSVFENTFTLMCQFSGVACTEFPEGCRRVGRFKILQVKTPWDFILSFNSRSAMIDTKTGNADNFSFSQIKDHQLSEMLLHSAHNVLAGYVIELKSKNKVIYADARILKTIKKRESLNDETPGIVTLGTSQKFDTRLIFTAF